MNTLRGFTLVEVMVTTAIVGILASLAYPSFAAPLLRARRTDGLTALLQLQINQERWRSEHGGYATLAELRLAASSALGYYRLTVAEASSDGFVAFAHATGAQAQDAACKVLGIRVADGDTRLSSGADEQASNSDAGNKRCWNL